jgi:hypothetical protein
MHHVPANLYIYIYIYKSIRVRLSIHLCTLS